MAVNTTLIHGASINKNSPPTSNGGGTKVSLPGFFGPNHMNLSISDEVLSKHTMLIGGIGCGKTNIMNFFIKQIKSNMSLNDVMVIFDTKGDFLKGFYSSKDDIVISSSRIYKKFQTAWNIYKEIVADGWDDDSITMNAYEIASSLFKEAISRSSNPFFPNAARDLFASILIAQIRLGKDDMSYRKKFLNNHALRKFFDSLSSKKIISLLSTPAFSDLTSALTYIGDGTSTQALGVIAEMQSVARQIFISSFAEDGRFSVREFIRSKGARTLFIEYDLSIGATLTPIYRLLFDLALKEAMGRNAPEGNVYLFCDEFKLLPHLEHIDDGVNFGRSLGVKVIAGLQSIEQLYEIYGESRGKNIAAGFSSIYAFKANDTCTREFISDLHGKNVVLDQFRTSSNTIVEEKRDGKTVEDWDLLSLRVGEAIVCLPFEKPFKFKFDLFKG